MSAPKVTAVAEASPAERAGVRPGDEVLSLNGRRPRDVIEYQQLADGERVALQVRRSGKPGATGRAGRAGSSDDEAVPGQELRLSVRKHAGEPLGMTVESAVFDRVRTCDNHCAFCFIHQLPKGLRRSLYLKDDDYRLSFLYGNFTTLTRFTELDAERVLQERLGPLFVSIHATDPEVRTKMLRNPKGATSLRWLRVLLDGGIEVHGQVVVCPGVNDGAVLEDTLVTLLDRYPELATLGVVPLGISRHNHEPEMRPHTGAEARAVCATVASWQDVYRSVLGRPFVFAADEYYLLAGLPFPSADAYCGFPQHENGIGMARAFERSFSGDAAAAHGVRPGFFAWVDGAPAEGYRAPRATTSGRAGEAPTSERLASADTAAPPTTAVVTGAYGAMVLRPLLDGIAGVRLLEVENDFFGGNIGVAGLLTGTDLSRVLAAEPGGDRYLLPDACLSEGRFLDGMTLADLPLEVEVVPADGASLRLALGAAR